MANPFSELNHEISLERGKQLTSRYRRMREEILKDEHKGKDILPLSETFNRKALDDLLAKPGCAGFRIYFGMDEGNLVKAVLVAVNDKNEDILPADVQGKDSRESGDGYLWDEGKRCPPQCPPPSGLYQP